MSVEQNKAAVRRMDKELWNKGGDLFVIPEYIAPTFILHGPTEYKGPEGYRQWVIMHQTAFPDLSDTIEKIIAEGDMVVYTGTLRGTFKGEYMGTKPTGNKFALPYAALFRFEQGKAVDLRLYLDTLTYFNQLGIPIPQQ